MRKIAVSNLGEEEFDQFKVTHLTRESVRAELETLFNRSPAAMRKIDRDLLKKLFLQFEAARTMAPNLQKESADLTAASREKIKTKNFALPEQEKYPIHDAAHARNALARVSQHGTPEEKARVRSAVANKWPGVIGEETKEDLKKESSIAPNVDAFFQAEGYLTEAQRLFPELQKVAAEPKQVARLRPPQGKIPESGAVPTKPILSGGNA